MTVRKATKLESAHMGRVAAMGCICCLLLDMRQMSKTEVHHLTTGRGRGQRNGHFLTMPLCKDDCHRGRNGIHGDKIYLGILKMTELDLLNATLERLYGR